MSEEKWIPCSEKLPPQNIVVETKIDDGRGVRNIAKLKLCKRLWVFDDDSMYVYYRPTHWRKIQEADFIEPTRR